MRKRIVSVIENEAQPLNHIGGLLSESGVRPAAAQWYAFVSHLLLFAGAVSLGISVIFMVAFNWDDLSRLLKFALVESVIVVAVLAYFLFSGDHVRNAAMITATLCVGGLLALFGQVYQTGADPWQLFLTWALLILPWVVVTRMPAMWLLFFILLNTAWLLFMDTRPALVEQLFDKIYDSWYANSVLSSSGVVLLNTAGLFAVRNTAHKLMPPTRWVVCCLALFSCIGATSVGVDFDFGRLSTLFVLIVWGGWLLVMFRNFRPKSTTPDVFMLALMVLSIFVVSVDTLYDLFYVNSFAMESLFLLCVTTLLVGAGLTAWLRRMQKEVHDDAE